MFINAVVFAITLSVSFAIMGVIMTLVVMELMTSKKFVRWVGRWAKSYMENITEVLEEMEEIEG